MLRKKGELRKLVANLSEAFSSAWLLLSDTTNFLSRMNLLDAYEQDLKGLRDRLYHGRNDPAAAREVKEAIVALRRSLRLAGHDLRLGSRDIILEGFRNDEALGEGFRRLVLGISEDELYVVSGDSNHIELSSYLELQLRAKRKLAPYRPHFLWYRWRNNVLVLSGAASESADQFEELKRYFPDHKELLLRRLKGI